MEEKTIIYLHFHTFFGVFCVICIQRMTAMIVDANFLLLYYYRYYVFEQSVRVRKVGASAGFW